MRVNLLETISFYSIRNRNQISLLSLPVEWFHSSPEPELLNN